MDYPIVIVTNQREETISIIRIYSWDGPFNFLTTCMLIVIKFGASMREFGTYCILVHLWLRWVVSPEALLLTYTKNRCRWRFRPKLRPLTLLDMQGSHRLEKYLNIQDCLEKSLKIKLALKSTWKTQRPWKVLEFYHLQDDLTLS